MSEKRFDAKSAVEMLASMPMPIADVSLERLPGRWILFTSLNHSTYTKVVEMVEQYVNQECCYWMKNSPAWSGTCHYPVNGSIEVSELYDADEVFRFLQKKLTGEQP